MRIPNKISAVLLSFTVLLSGLDLSAQNTISSPYTKYGIGEMNLYTNAINASMGGVGYAMRRNNMVNFKNPASYSAVDTTSFVFDIGFYTDMLSLRSQTAKSTGNVGGMSHVLFAFPVHKTLKIAGGLVPVSTIDFSASETFKQDTINVGHYKTTYAGNGGVNKVFLGLAYSPSERMGFLHNWSVGMNISYMFGNYYRSSTTSFPDSAAFLSSRIEENYRISAFTADFGLQYFEQLSNGDLIGFGASYVLPCSMPTKNEYRHYTFASSSGTESLRDSVQYRDDDGTIRMPYSAGGGVSYERPNKFFVSADATFTKWSLFEVQGISYSPIMRDSWKVNAGLEYKPNAYGNYLEKISYRFGLNYSTGELYLREHQLACYGIAFGFGLPMKKIGTQININFEYGRQGTTEDNLIRKDYFRIGVSFSAKDIWFFKIKYQ